MIDFLGRHSRHYFFTALMLGMLLPFHFYSGEEIHPEGNENEIELCTTALKKRSTINGVSFVASDVELTLDHLRPVQRIHPNWIAFMPFAFVQKEGNQLLFNSPRQWRGERVEGIRESVELARKLDLKVCLKLHVWSHYIPYTGDFELKTEEDWQEFEKSYTEYCMLYARLAEALDVELFCIGVEWRNFVRLRPEYWKGLIREVRAVYSGRVTYAANWDDYDDVPFWRELDVIGIDGYFPLSAEVVPDSCDLVSHWDVHMNEMAKVVRKENKSILFLEYGYRSMEYNTKTPWDWSSNHPVSMEAQSNAYKALFNSLWQQDWFEGGFLWKWYHNDAGSGGPSNNRFTPQNKPVEKVIQRYYRYYK